MSEYDKARRLVSPSQAFVIRPTQRIGGVPLQGHSNILLSGVSSKKPFLLLQLMQVNREYPSFIVTDRGNSTLSHSFDSTSYSTFIVKDSVGSAYYNYFRNRSSEEVFSLFLRIAQENNLFSQHQVEAEQLLRCIIRLAMLDTSVFEIISRNGLSGNLLIQQTEILFRSGLITSDVEKNNLISQINSTISGALYLKAIFDDFSAIMSSMISDRRMRIPFSAEDIIKRNKQAVFCLDGEMRNRNFCWYVSRLLVNDLQRCIAKIKKPFVLMLDSLDKEKIALFSPLFNAVNIIVVININDTACFIDNTWVSGFNEFYIFSHIDGVSLTYWRDFFGTNRVVDYTYNHGRSRTNKFPLLPTIGNIFGETQESAGVSYRYIDRNVFETNDIRGLQDNECIYYNHSQRSLLKMTF